MAHRGKTTATVKSARRLTSKSRAGSAVLGLPVAFAVVELFFFVVLQMHRLETGAAGQQGGSSQEEQDRFHEQ
jgi:hypothetical protein